MKRVNNVKKIKVGNSSSPRRNQSAFLGSIVRTRNLMLNKKALSDKNGDGGTTFKDYVLDLMKLK